MPDEDNNNTRLLMRAIENNDEETVKTMIESYTGIVNKWVDIDGVDIDGLVADSMAICKNLDYCDYWTPLQYAIDKGSNIHIIQSLIDAGANINTKGSDGGTALHLASYNTDDSSVVEILIDNGGDVNAVDNCLSTPIHFAMYNDIGHIIIPMLAANGANVNARTENGRNPIHTLFTSYNKVIVNNIQTIIDVGGDVNAQDKEKSTPLHIALTEDDPCIDAISVLLKNGAKICISNYKDKTAIDLIDEIKNPDIRAAIQMKLQLYV